MKPLQILIESFPFLAVRRDSILLARISSNCSGTLNGTNNCRRCACTLSIHRGAAVRRSAAVAARRQRRDQQRAEHRNVAVRSKAVNVRTQTQSSGAARCVHVR